MVKYISIKVCEELYDATAQEADRRDISLGEVAAEALAKLLGCPEEFGEVPRARPGRKRFDQIATNGKNGHKK